MGNEHICVVNIYIVSEQYIIIYMYKSKIFSFVSARILLQYFDDIWQPGWGLTE